VHQAQKFEAVGQLAGGVAHDFNNVIGAILGWAELGIDQSRDHPVLLERFNRIREQANRAAALTRELLTFARRRALQATAVNRNAATSQLISLLDKVIDKDIDLKFVTAPLDYVKADATQNTAVCFGFIYPRWRRRVKRRPRPRAIRIRETLLAGRKQSCWPTITNRSAK